jgi:hypothetical protein
MTYEEIIPIAKKGNIIKLPTWDGYFKWNYQFNKLEFINKEYRSFNNIDTTRTDYYYII